MAETTVPAFAMRSPRFDGVVWSSDWFCAAPGNAVSVLLQQLPAGLMLSFSSSDISVFLACSLLRYRVTGSNPSSGIA